MVSYATIQHKIDRGLGKAASKLGQPFSIYRITSTSSGDYPTGWSLLAQNQPFFRRRIKDTKLESAVLSTGTLFYQIIGDVDPYLLGDVFLCTDPAYSPGVSYGAGATLLPGTLEFNAFALAWHMPVNEPVGGRLDRRAGIYRPAPGPAPLPDGSAYWKTTYDQDTPLVLIDGQFLWGQPGATASWVPCGLASTHRVGGDVLFPPRVPGMTDALRYYVYLPPLLEYTASEGDAIVTEDGARYLVVHPYRQDAGVVGSQLVVKRMISQDT
jgi:hypothetical protein